ncbi:chemotaxis protein [Shewanella sp. Isolate8]|uniref:chemotaxis protein n=1 Tax=Shewanella sp. Isolate8 TaxID=2908529 RepID=UPI001EFED145|nr:chemotaxis protein [Shewanella sp. Isolate8]MCG9746233.1 chemotaxis protein [Shewanella sp. Isolate8]
MGLKYRSVLLVIGMLSLSACSLLEVKLESGIEPLPQAQLNMRVFSRDFSHTFYAKVEQGADQIVLEKGDDLFTKSNALMWKINSEQALQRAIFQASPVAAMVDTWTLTAQMSAFFDGGAGASLFGDQQNIAIEVSKVLQADFERSIKGFVEPGEFKKYQAFILDYVAKNPITDLSFARHSAFNDWLAYRNISEFEAVTTFGTVPEVMSDVSDRMAMIAEQMPKILGWKAELYALHANINPETVQQTLQSISDTSAKFQQLMAQSPEMMQTLAVDLRRELMPLLAQLSETTDDKLAKLSVEREALTQMVKQERLALEEMVNRQRVAAAADLDAISQHAVERAFAELTKTLKSLILYLVLFFVVCFFAPLGLGVWLGKRMALKQQASST